jgi:hypothetical protein
MKPGSSSLQFGLIGSSLYMANNRRFQDKIESGKIHAFTCLAVSL